jgi:MoxR-like ATPase
MNKETVYELFDKFLEKLGIGESMFSTNKVFTQSNIDELEKRIVKNSIGTELENKEEHEKILNKVDLNNKDVNKDNLPVKVNFDRKIEYQLRVGLFKDDNEADEGVLELFSNLIWLRYLPINGIGHKKKVSKVCIGNLELNKVFFSDIGVASYGMLQQQIFEDLEALIEFFKVIITEETAVSSEDFKIKLQQKVEESHKCESKFHERPIINMLQHFCDKQNYVDCASYSHKKEIVEAFKTPLSIDVNVSIDNKILLIREKLLAFNHLKDTWKLKNEFRSFYHQAIRQFWNFQGIDTKEDFSELDALNFKKSIIFYGPPGTSKTHNAKKLAEILIRQGFIKANVDHALGTDFKVEYDKRISNLQLHANYSYEDFIIGMRISNNETEWEQGWLLKKIDSINKENGITENRLPYVVILDEINRVDLSRLFGELFSAIENRGADVELSALDKDDKRITVNIPSNLYFIGTMNEIDFSLERIDFALRRRFVWYFYGYNEDVLKTIIFSNIEKNTISKSEFGKCYINLCDEEKNKVDNKMSNDNVIQFFKEGHLKEFIKRATNLNKFLEDDEEFGRQWQIGHTFFAEILEIVFSVNQNNKMKNNLLFKTTDDKLKSAKNSVEILWSISIKPMLDAYCGNLDKDSKKKKLDSFEDIFLKGGNGK